MSQTSLFSSRAARVLALVLIFGAALAIRLYDLTDLPLDFHPTRQFLSLSKARALYYETRPAGIPEWQVKAAIRAANLKADLEPVVFEHLVAFTYRFAGEQLWIARIYSSLFWLMGGIFLFLLAREFVSFEGALVSTAYYLIFPYAIIASRSFQPDIPMIVLMLAFLWVFSRWTRSPQWILAVLAGLLGGLAIFIKFPGAFFVIGGALGLALRRFSLRDLVQNIQAWVIAVLGALPSAIYVANGMVGGDMASKFKGKFVPSLLFDPFNYLNWEVKADMAVGGIFIMLGLLGWFLVKDRNFRIFLVGLGCGYLAFGLFFNYHIATHDYYHLPLLPIVALSLAPLGELIFRQIGEAALPRWMRAAVALILIFGLFSVLWNVRNRMKAVDHRPEAAWWAEIGAQFDDEARVVALTQDYGSRLEFWGWRRFTVWPYVGDAAYANIRGGVFSFDDLFEKYTSKKNYFLVTDLEEFNRQPELRERLFASYPVYLEGNGYLIFDLKDPLPQDANGS